MSLINITNLTFSYDGSYDNIFENVSFQIDSNWKLGFIGRNGRGKTTFLKLMLGHYEYSGNISFNVNFEYFPYEILKKVNLTCDIIEEINPGFERWQLLRELNLLNIDEDVLYRPFNTLSNGEQTKVLLATLFLKENNFLLIDEPTNHLDSEAREIVADYLNSKKGFILISHDRKFLDKCVDHILSINKTNIEIQKGNFSSWYANKQAQDNLELAQNERLKDDIKRLFESAKRTSDWSIKVEKTKNSGKQASGLKPDKGYVGHKAAKMMKRSKSIEGRQQAAAEEKSGLLKNIETTQSLKLLMQNYHSDKLVSFNDVAIFYNNKIVCNNLSFEICRGDRVCLCGKNGSGKSSVLKLILGNDIAYTGSIKIGPNLKLSYVSQDTSHLCGNLKDLAQKNNIDESLFKSILRKLDFERVQFDKNISNFSGGQKKKVLIAKSLCQQANLYIWDEPLNFIDVFSRIQIEELLLQYAPTILFVEHDNIFRDKIATKIITL